MHLEVCTCFLTIESPPHFASPPDEKSHVDDSETEEQSDETADLRDHREFGVLEQRQVLDWLDKFARTSFM